MGGTGTRKLRQESYRKECVWQLLWPVPSLKPSPCYAFISISSENILLATPYHQFCSALSCECDSDQKRKKKPHKQTALFTRCQPQGTKSSALCLLSPVTWTAWSGGQRDKVKIWTPVPYKVLISLNLSFFTCKMEMLLASHDLCKS